MTRLAIILALLCGPAWGQASNCANRALVVAKLAGKYGEAQIGAGLQNQTHIFEVWVSDESGTFTILMTRADGSTCIMASGRNWRAGDEKAKDIEG